MRSRLLMLSILILAIPTAAQNGGQFTITQSVIANGGGNSAGGNFVVTGTTAQTTVGVNPASGNFAISGGFWQPLLAPPTAAMVSVGGRVTTANGFGIANVRVTMTNQTGESATALTNSFGNFSFAQVQSGEIYVLTVSSRRYQFSVPTQILSVSDNIKDIIFIANLE